MRILAGTALSIGAAIVLLAGCGGPQPPIGVHGVASSHPDALPYHRTFHYTGNKQSFVVPARVTSITIVARGAAGAGEAGTQLFGRGGRVYAVIPVHPRETLYVFVGGQGSATGGFNGGGNPGWSPHSSRGYGGGGASDVRENGYSLRHRILVAAGGGGQGCCPYDGGDDGGNGGPNIGEAGAGSSYAAGGGGGTQSQGGAGGSGTQSGNDGFGGRFGHGGRGGKEAHLGGCNSSNYRCVGGAGGGGGGGYYGGGGGGGGVHFYSGGEPGAGGGGGSSYVEPKAMRAKMWRGWKNATGDGLIVLSWGTQ